MRLVVFCARTFPLHLFLCAQSLLVPDRRTRTELQEPDRRTQTGLQGPDRRTRTGIQEPDRRTQTGLQGPDRRTRTGIQGWPQTNKQVLLRNREEQEQEEDTLNPEDTLKSALGSRNETEWKGPHCGVPDYPNVDVRRRRLERRRLERRSLRRSSLRRRSLRRKSLRRSAERRRRRFALFGGRWEKTELTYRITRFPWQMSQDKVRSVFTEAFGVWSDVTPLRFREVVTEDADIIIDFNRYWHGDDLPFDGPGGILAHAYFPQTQQDGEVHFDYDEHWTVGNNVGTDLLQVAAHEFGHVLGLQHSLEPDAVMCPFYSDSYPLQLSDDDRRGIQYLYGPPRHSETNEIDPELPDACRTNFDAVTMIRGELFFFKSQYVWRIRDGHLQAGYPALSSRHWSGFPAYIDAAYEDTSGNIWFFQGGSFWVFDAERKISGPESVQQLGLPVSDIHAALRWDDGHVEKAFFFKSSFFWSFMVQENRVEDPHPRSTDELAGLPSSIDAAFLDRHGYATFLSGLDYWRFDPVALMVLEGYPRRIGTDFFSCSDSV